MAKAGRKTLVAKAGGVCVRSGVVGFGVGLVSGVGKSSNAVSSGRFCNEKKEIMTYFRISVVLVTRSLVKKVGVMIVFQAFGQQDMGRMPRRV